MVKNHLELQFLSFISLIWIKENNIQWNTSKKELPWLKSKDGLKSFNPLEIAIINLNTEPEKQLIWMIQQKERSSEALKWIVLNHLESNIVRKLKMKCTFFYEI